MRTLAIGALCVALSSCVSVIEEGGRILDGAVFREKTVAVYQSLEAADGITVTHLQGGGKAAPQSLVITLNALPEAAFHGTFPNEDGVFVLESMHFIGGTVSGWNEFTLDLIGTGSFTLQGDMGNLSIKIDDSGTISAGKIRHKGNRLSGDQAITSLLNRQHRITALTDWMHIRADAPQFIGRKDFDAYWKALLLPELVSPRKRPASFTEAAAWTRAQDIRWNTAYTASLFPEELRVLRDSGALLRDWEEAPVWIYLQYQWKDIVARMSNRYTVLKIK